MKGKIITVALFGFACARPVNAPVSAPVANADLAQTQLSATLQPDEFDAPAATAVEEARKAAPSMPAAASPEAIYVCPMHPEVTSATPGTCPKCGMTLVRATGKKEH